MTKISNPSPFREFIRKEFLSPDISRALMVMLGVIVPVIYFQLAGRIELAVFGSLTGQLVSSSKIRGTYPQRAFILIMGVTLIAAAAFLGTIAGGNLITAVLFMGIIAGLGGISRGLGEHGQSLGICAALLFLFSLHGPNTTELGLERVQAVFIGGAWASMLHLILWPFRPDLPYLIALAKPWELGSDFVAKMADVDHFNRDKIESEVTQIEANLRDAINKVLPFLGKSDKNPVSIRREILKIARSASRFGVTARAIHNDLEKLMRNPKYDFLIPSIQNAARALSIAAGSISDRILSGSKEDENITHLRIKGAETLMNFITKRISQSDLKTSERIELQGIINLMKSSINYHYDALKLMVRLEDKRKIIKDTGTGLINPIYALKRQWHNTRKELHFASQLLRHGLRLLLVAVIGIALYKGFEIPRGYWIVLTVIIVLQPDFGTTRVRSWQRVSGTLIGAIFGTLMLALPFNFGMLDIIIAISVFLFSFYQSRNYGISVVFVTIQLVATLEMSEHSIDWHVAAHRLIATLIGTILSISAAYLLWPSWEHIRFRARIVKVLRANKRYLLQIEHELKEKQGLHMRVIGDRRKAEVETINALDAIKRIEKEPGKKEINIAIANLLAFHNSKLTKELNAFTAVLPRVINNFDFPEAEAFMIESSIILEEMAIAIETDARVSIKPNLDLYLKKIEEHILSLREQSNKCVENQRMLLEEQLINAMLIRSIIDRIAAEIIAMCYLSGDLFDYSSGLNSH
ncbi:FUSC family protein [Solitalea koreensis]|uniref:Uncharacterized membrane protein YccC n=1 Tax=Solitalea koreensis TaxID=543615 RepID=A0A521CX85_9SPHI|nr:FUSC family protein [Solitalea koreensis]SMO64055.1 Uncharacterized membrane protein YccC [Solitalea koreensis]